MTPHEKIKEEVLKEVNKIMAKKTENPAFNAWWNGHAYKEAIDLTIQKMKDESGNLANNMEPFVRADERQKCKDESTQWLLDVISVSEKARSKGFIDGYEQGKKDVEQEFKRNKVCVYCASTEVITICQEHIYSEYQKDAQEEFEKKGIIERSVVAYTVHKKSDLPEEVQRKFKNKEGYAVKKVVEELTAKEVRERERKSTALQIFEDIESEGLNPTCDDDAFCVCGEEADYKKLKSKYLAEGSNVD